MNDPLLLDVTERVCVRERAILLYSNQLLLYDVHFKWNNFSYSITPARMEISRAHKTTMVSSTMEILDMHNLLDVTFYHNNESLLRWCQQVRYDNQGYRGSDPALLLQQIVLIL